MTTLPWRLETWWAQGGDPDWRLPGVVAALLCGLEPALTWKPVPSGPVTWRWLILGLLGAARLGFTARRLKPGLGGVLVPTVCVPCLGAPRHRCVDLGHTELSPGLAFWGAELLQ